MNIRRKTNITDGFARALLLLGLYMPLIAMGDKSPLQALVKAKLCVLNLSQSKQNWTAAEIETVKGHLAELEVSDWILDPASHPLTSDLVRALTRISPASREMALTSFDQANHDQAFAINFLKLALYDRVAWFEYFKELLIEGDEIGNLSRVLAPVLSQMPEPLKTELLTQAKEAYPTARKNTEVDDNRGRMSINAPKRALDILINALISPKQMIAREVAKGRIPFEAYGDWMAQINKTLQLNAYSSDAVWTALDELQSYLRQQVVLGRATEEDAVTFIGSLPSGRSKPNSDLDGNIQNERLETFDWDYVKEVINRQFRLNRIPIQFSEFSVHQVSRLSADDEDFNSTLLWTNERAAEVTPVQFRVTARTVVMLVYPPTHSGSRFTLPDLNVSPDRYVIRTLPPVVAIHRRADQI